MVSCPSCKQVGAGGLRLDDRLDWDVVVPLVIEGMGNRDAHERHEGQRRQPPDVPDQSESQNDAKPAENNASTRVFRHMDGLETIDRAFMTSLFHIRPCIEVMNDWSEGEVILRWRG